MQQATGGPKDDFQTTVTINVNGAPAAVTDSYQVAFNTTKNVAAPGVLGNDTDPENNPLAITSVQDALHGSVSIVAGNVVFTPTAGYTGPLSLEVFNDEFRSAPARANAVDAMRSLLWLEEQVRRSHAPEAPAYKVPLFDPPTPPAFSGWSFVEFAADPAAAARLGDGPIVRLRPRPPIRRPSRLPPRAPG